MKTTFQALKAKSDKIVGVGRDEVGLVVLVEKKLELQDLHPDEIVPRDIGGLSTRVLEVGKIVAQKERTDTWEFPIPPGVSIGHPDITAGTFGCVVKDNETSTPLILSNNHVMAATNQAQIGDPILQPGKYDGGSRVFAHLVDFVPIIFPTSEPTCDIAGGVASFLNTVAELIGSKHRLQPVQINQTANLIDAAIAQPLDGAVIPEIFQIGRPMGAAPATLGLNCQKSGRTTGLTRGYVVIVDATVDVDYGVGVATFENQIILTAMSAGGDSGSLIVTDEQPIRAVALLYAGSDKITIGCPWHLVADLLKVHL